MHLKSIEPESTEPWWRVGPMWLVVGGPLVVVAAAIATAVIAINGADPVLDKAAYQATLEQRYTGHVPAGFVPVQKID